MRIRPRLTRPFATAAVVATVVAAVATVVLESAGAAKNARRSCRYDDGRVLVLTKSGRITSVQDDGFRRWYACLNRRGRRVFLGVHDPTGQQQLSRPTLVGSFAAFESFTPSTSATGPDAVLVDLVTRRNRSMPIPGAIVGMVLSRGGDLVVMSLGSRDQPPAVLRLNIRDGSSTLDTGAIEAGSLAMSPNGRFVYWRNAGQPRVFELSPLDDPKTKAADSPEYAQAGARGDATPVHHQPG
jgi:hypothetical protein